MDKRGAFMSYFSSVHSDIIKRKKRNRVDQNENKEFDRLKLKIV